MRQPIYKNERKETTNLQKSETNLQNETSDLQKKDNRYIKIGQPIYKNGTTDLQK